MSSSQYQPELIEEIKTMAGGLQLKTVTFPYDGQTFCFYPETCEVTPVGESPITLEQFGERYKGGLTKLLRIIKRDESIIDSI